MPKKGSTAIAEIVGWYGALAIVAAYALVSLHLLDVDSIWYQLLNLTGAIGIVIISIKKKVTQPALLNIIWSIVAVVAIINIFS